jgi:glycogen debranching enzyme
MARSPGLLTAARTKAFYPKLAAWTEWWMQNRDADGDGLPEYMNGCDSGWDNATVFDGGCPVASPDLPAYLVLQMDMLADLAARLGKSRPAADWHRRADALLQRMLERLWDCQQFVSLCLPTGEPFPEGDCLLNFIPIILGKRLPKPYRDRLAAALKPGGRFVTRHGPATESPASPLYNPTGYWRGPIWAPSALMIVDGLRRGGYAAQAAAIAKRFRDLCARTCFAENFEARSGEPLCDKAYTWTSSTFLAL